MAQIRQHVLKKTYVPYKGGRKYPVIHAVK